MWVTWIRYCNKVIGRVVFYLCDSHPLIVERLIKEESKEMIPIIM